jgi:hypothetical protein
LTQGIEEESDPIVKVRRSQSVSLPAIGALPATQAAILALDAVQDVVVYENVTGTMDANDIPGHSIWAVVEGGNDAEIGQAIYSKRNVGCGMKGTEEVSISQVNGVPFVVKFDRVSYENLYVSLTLTSIDPAHAIDDEWLKTQIFESIAYKIYQPADFTAITALVKTLDPLAVVTAGGVSKTDSGYTGFVYPTTIQKRFIMSTTRISISVV